MKKKFNSYFLITLYVIILFTCSCKKKDTPQQATASHPTTNISIDGAAVTNMTHTSFNSSGNYGVVAYASGGNPEIQIIFFGTQAPNTGTYIITSGTLSSGYCTFAFSNSTGNSSANLGSVNVTAGAAPYNSVSFSNISVSGSGGNHSVSGTITY